MSDVSTSTASKRVTIDQLGSRMTRGATFGSPDILEFTKGELGRVSREFVSSYKLDGGRTVTAQETALDESYSNGGRTVLLREMLPLHTNFASHGARIDETELTYNQLDVLNPPFQFNAVDDVRSDPSFPKIGRIYNENIRRNYPIVVFQPGVMKINQNGLDFMMTNMAGTNNLNKLVRGEDPSLWDVLMFVPSALFSIVKNTAGFLGEKLGLIKPIIEFKVQKRLFKKYCNDMIREVAAYMGLVDIKASRVNRNVDSSREDSDFSDLDGNEGAKGDPINMSEGSSRSDGTVSGYCGNDLSIYTFLKSLDTWGSEMLKGEYLPFLGNKDMSPNESISNSTKTHPIEEAFNRVAQDAQAREEGGQAQDLASVADDPTAMIRAMVKNEGKRQVFKGLKNVSGEVINVMAGDGRVVFPETWESSSFSRSYSLSFKFHSPYGDKNSIFENVMIPTIVLMTLAIPRQIGKTSYGSPFAVKVFSKGLISCPAGMITSVTIKRGDDANDRTIHSLMRTYEVSVDIKDLSPTLMISFSRGLFGRFHAKNTGMREYIAVMSGMSLGDKSSMSKGLQRWANTFAASVQEALSFSNIKDMTNNAIMNIPVIGIPFRIRHDIKRQVGLSRSNVDGSIDY